MKRIATFTLCIVILLPILLSISVGAFAQDSKERNTLDQIYESLNRQVKAEKERKKAVISSILIPVAKMEEFDFKTREEIFKRRKEAVAKHFQHFRKLYWMHPQGKEPGPGAALFESAPPEDLETDEPYQPSHKVFRRMESGKAWWGIHGMSFYGPGDKAIAGPSEESRYLLNPYLFVGVVEKQARYVTSSPLPPRAIYPKLKKLQFFPQKRMGQAHYDLTSYISVAKTYGYQGMDTPTLMVVAYNARDFHFPYIALDVDKTKNLAFPDRAVNPTLIGQHIGVGYSCSFPDGCNNMVSLTPPIDLTVRKLPALLHAKLWRQKPKEIEERPDLEFRLIFR